MIHYRSSFLCFILILFGTIPAQKAFSQGQAHPNGTQDIGGGFFQYSKLTRNFSFFPPFFERSLALGVYDNQVAPNSILDVNSTTNNLSGIHPNVNSRGELLRTTAPTGVTANWRFFHGVGNQVGRFWSTSSNDQFHLGASNGRMHFHSAEDEWRFIDDGGLNIGRVYSDPGNDHLEIAAPNGQLRFHSSGNPILDQMRIWEDEGVSINAQNQIIDQIALLNIGMYSGFGDRPWMNHGTFYGQNTDGMYVGMKQEVYNNNFDNNDAIINWNNNVGAPFRDFLRFVFTHVDNGNTDASTPNGLEMARFDAGDGNEANVAGADPDNSGLGIGNFYNGGNLIEVTTRLDVLNGDVRIRDLPNNQNNNLDNVVVVQPNGVLRVRDANSLPGGGGDNDWFVNNSTNVPGAITDDIYTENRVGIGDEFAPAGPSTYRGKLHLNYDEVYSVPPTSGGLFNVDYSAIALNPPSQVTGVLGRVVNIPVSGGSNGLGVGVSGVAQGNGEKIGVLGDVRGSGINKGVEGKALDPIADENIGGKFTAASGASTQMAYGVWAIAPPAFNNTNFAAGKFDGDIYVQDQHLLSDQMFKKNIDSLDSAMAKIMQLEPRSFNLDTANYGYMGLTGGKKYGMIAQDVEQVMPELVNTIRQPAVRDSAGNVIHQAFDYKTLSYDRFIPFLVQGVQEQQAQIDSLNERVDSLEQRNDSLLTLIQQNQARDQQQSDSLADLFAQVDSLGMDSLMARIQALENCVDQLPAGLGCEHGNGKMREEGEGNAQTASITIETKVHVNYDSSMTGVKGDRPVEEGTELHQNRPNPFRYVTTFSYDLAREGRVELIVHDQQGRYVTHVVDAEQSSGPHEVRWNATDVESGIYYYTLRVDGMEWVKKAIKLK